MVLPGVLYSSPRSKNSSESPQEIPQFQQKNTSQLQPKPQPALPLLGESQDPEKCYKYTRYSAAKPQVIFYSVHKTATQIHLNQFRNRSCFMAHTVSCATCFTKPKSHFTEHFIFSHYPTISSLKYTSNFYLVKLNIYTGSCLKLKHK